MSFDFDGVNDHILNAATAPIGNATNGITLACWARPDVIGGSLFNISDATGNSGAVRLIMLTTGTRATSITTGNISSTADTTAGTPTVGTWGHYCGIFSSASRSAFFNGGNKVTTTATNNATGFTRTQIGARRIASATDNFFNGQIADVAIWNTSLADAEVFSLGQGAAASLIRPQNLVLYIALIGNLLDYSKTSLTLTNSGGALTSNLHPRIYL